MAEPLAALLAALKAYQMAGRTVALKAGRSAALKVVEMADSLVDLMAGRTVGS